MIMDEKNSNVQDEEVISWKCSCGIIARMVKGAKQLQKQLELITNNNQLHVIANVLVAFQGISSSGVGVAKDYGATTEVGETTKITQKDVQPQMVEQQLLFPSSS